MPKLIGAAAVILDSKGRVLLVKHSYGKNNWDLPGGKGEENESAEETAKREVHEEVGLEVGVGQLTGDQNFEIFKYCTMINLNPLFELSDGTGSPLLLHNLENSIPKEW